MSAFVSGFSSRRISILWATPSIRQMGAGVGIVRGADRVYRAIPDFGLRAAAYLRSGHGWGSFLAAGEGPVLALRQVAGVPGIGVAFQRGLAAGAMSVVAGLAGGPGLLVSSARLPVGSGWWHRGGFPRPGHARRRGRCGLPGMRFPGEVPGPVISGMGTERRAGWQVVVYLA